MLFVLPETQKLCVVIFNSWTPNQYDSKPESRICRKNKRPVVPVLYHTSNFTERTLTRRDVVGMTDFRTWDRFFAYTYFAVVGPWPDRCLLALTFGTFVRVAASRISYACTIYYGDLVGDGIDGNTARTVAGHVDLRSSFGRDYSRDNDWTTFSFSLSLSEGLSGYMSSIHTHT